MSRVTGVSGMLSAPTTFPASACSYQTGVVVYVMSYIGNHLTVTAPPADEPVVLAMPLAGVPLTDFGKSRKQLRKGIQPQPPGVIQ